jgi:acyl-CoA synthetase (AMP-forming)/AMP-acid ligase II/pimeloyl-ACP methyl ester carboxylesterase/acyl carrier protein
MLDVADSSRARAIAVGGALERDLHAPRTIAACLEARVAACPDGAFYSYQISGEHRSQTYQQTWQRSASIAAGLAAVGRPANSPIVLLIEDIIDFVPAFWACLRGGYFAVPLAGIATQAIREPSSTALQDVVSRFDKALILSDSVFEPVARRLAQSGDIAAASLASVETQRQTWRDRPPLDPPFVIPTSGSTGRLKLVTLSHNAVLHRSFAVSAAKQQGAFLGTFPLDGVSGLHAAFLNHPAWIQLSPYMLAGRPLSLFDAVERFRVLRLSMTNSTAMLVLAAQEKLQGGWNLDSLIQVGFGAEPVSADVMRRFARVLEEQGAPRGVIRAGYGTTETGYLVAGGDPLAPSPDGSVRLGGPVPGVSLRVVGEANEILSEGETGHIQVRCPQKSFSGYWGEPEANKSDFTADGWWRTGDMGSLLNGQLSISGRAKEVLIVHGRKHSLAEIDAYLQASFGADVRTFSCAVLWPDETAEKLAIVFVVARHRYDEVAQIAGEIQGSIARRFGLQPNPVIATSAERIPLTATGKIRRLVLAERVRSGYFGAFRRSPPILRQDAQAQAAETTVEVRLREIWREVLQLDGDPYHHANFFDLGGDSLRSIQLLVRVEEEMRQRVPVEPFFADPTMATLLRLVSDGAAPAETVQPNTGGGRQLAQDLEAACRGNDQSILDRASSYQWTAACLEMWEAGRLEAAEQAARLLHGRYSKIPYLGVLVDLFDAMPRHMPRALDFKDDPSAEIQIVRRVGSDAVLFAFCATNGTLGLPLNFIHEWLGRLSASVVYIKDFRDLLGSMGFPSLGPDRAASVTALRRIARELGGKRIYTIGVSVGGYAALSYALELEAVAVLNFAGATDLSREFMLSLGRIPERVLTVQRIAPEYARNLREACAAAVRPPYILHAYGTELARDRKHAERMAGLPNVELIAVDYDEHNVVDILIRRGQFMPLLQRLITIERNKP